MAIINNHLQSIAMPQTIQNSGAEVTFAHCFVGIMTLLLVNSLTRDGFADAFSPQYVPQLSAPQHDLFPKRRRAVKENAEDYHNRTPQYVSSDPHEYQGQSKVLTSAVLKIAYDGTHFRGWTGTDNTSLEQNSKGSAKSRQSQSRRSRTLQRKGAGFVKGSASIRTVEHALQISLAKIYGNISPKNIIIDSCSRLDAGVHATSLVVQFYCLSSIQNDLCNDVTSNNTWAELRPQSPTDTNFLPLPFDSDLSKLVFVLNRMLPPDVRVLASSPAPEVLASTPLRGSLHANAVSNAGISFHPTLHVKSKTYTYQFAIGPFHDPLRSHCIWHLDGSSRRAVGMNGKRFCPKRAREAANVFVDPNQPRDYSAFRSAFRGNERGRVQSPICRVYECEIVLESNEILPSWESITNETSYGSRLGPEGFSKTYHHQSNPSYNTTNVGTYTVMITGDRFLYKMVRNMVGCIVAAACGYLEVSDIQTCLKHPEDDINHSMRRICAPARGLTLSSVEFPGDILFDWRAG